MGTATGYLGGEAHSAEVYREVFVASGWVAGDVQAPAHIPGLDRYELRAVFRRNLEL